MQRWILIGTVVAVLFAGICGGGLWWMRQNRADQQWVPIPINPTTSAASRELMMGEIKGVLSHDHVLRRVVKDLSLQEKLGLGSEQEALDHLKGACFVREGEFTHPQTQEKIPTIDIGMNGKSKDRVVLGEVAVKLCNEARTLLGWPDGQ
jgi:hypothetical protein